MAVAVVAVGPMVRQARDTAALAPDLGLRRQPPRSPRT